MEPRPLPRWLMVALRVWQVFFFTCVLAFMMFFIGNRDIRPSDVSPWFLVIVIGLILVNGLIPIMVSRQYPGVSFRTRRGPL